MDPERQFPGGRGKMGWPVGFRGQQRRGSPNQAFGRKARRGARRGRLEGRGRQGTDEAGGAESDTFSAAKLIFWKLKSDHIRHRLNSVIILAHKSSAFIF